MNPTPCCICGVNAHLTDARLCLACERERRAEIAEKIRQEHRYESLAPAVPAGPWHEESEA